MSVLTACQKAAIRLVGQKPQTLFSTTDQFAMELADLANEAATDIAKAHDWQALTKRFDAVGDGTTVTFPLPSDYDRMLKKGDVHSTKWLWARFLPARDLDQWLDLMSWLTVGNPGYWIILNDEFNVWPRMAADEKATFYYISKYLTTNAKPQFDADADEFALDERLLTLSVIWRWRAQKRLEYAEDMRNFEIALSKAIADDKGSQIIYGRGFRRLGYDTRVAYPGALGK